MKLNEYLIDKETVSAKIGAYDSAGEYSEARAGTLACTPYRLVFVNGSDVTDISHRGVNSIEYSEGGYPTEYVFWAFIIGSLSTAAYVMSPVGLLILDLCSPSRDRRLVDGRYTCRGHAVRRTGTCSCLCHS